VPSLPGYGWSGPTTEPGWDVARVAEAWKVLMARLGYARYGAQGGDWGAMVTMRLAAIDGEHVAGLHSNMLLAFPPAGTEIPLSDEEAADVAAAGEFMKRGAAYQEIQGKNPQTLGYGLTDSPAGQLAWIAEKFGEWTDGGLSAVDRDQMLTNISVYWLTRTAGSSARLYHEAARSRGFGPPAPSTAPTGVAVFPEEIAAPVRRLAERTNRIVHWSEFDRGGHFAAMEEPDLLVGDVREFFRPLR